MPKPTWALWIPTFLPIFALLSGGLAGAIFQWYMTRPFPTTLTYAVTTTTVGTDPTVKSLIPDLKIQVGNEEIPFVHTHTIDFIVQRGPYLDTAEIAIIMPSKPHIYGMASDAPSPLHRISCVQISEGARCNIAPLTSRSHNKYQISIATNAGEINNIITSADKVDLLKLEEFLAQDRGHLGSFLSWAFIIAPILTLPVGFVVRKRRLEQQQLEQREQLQKEWDSFSSERIFFWNTLKDYYSSHIKATPEYPGNIEALIDSAELPYGLPIQDQESMYKYPDRHSKEFYGNNGLLYNFCSKVYPAKNPEFSSLKGYSKIPEASFDAFHDIRAKLAKFWNRWGEQVYVERSISLDSIAQIRTLDMNQRLLKLLSYLEVCLAQWTEDTSAGKVWLFHLAKEWPGAQRRAE